MKSILERPLQPSADVLSQDVSGETVLLDLKTDQYFGLDEVGGRIWALVGDGNDGETVVAVLLEEYEVERERLEQDVAACLEGLLEAGLLVEAAPGSGD